MSQIRYHLFFNPFSGAAQATGITEDRLHDAFVARGLHVVIEKNINAGFEDRIRHALTSETDVIIAAGGDGTVTAIASAIKGSEKAMVILPLGTANKLARDLHIPLDLEPWLDALPHMVPQKIDVCMVNSRVFLHKVVVGLLPGLAAGREHIRGGGIGAVLGFLRYFVRRVTRARRFALEITTSNGETRIARVQALAVASNAYDEAPGHFFSRGHLNEGFLTLYVLDRLSLGKMIKLAVGMVFGHWREDDALRIETVQSVVIRSKKPRLQVMLDGEVEAIETPLRFSILPESLTLLAPAQADGAATLVTEMELKGVG